MGESAARFVFFWSGIKGGNVYKPELRPAVEVFSVQLNISLRAAWLLISKHFNFSV